MSILPLPIASPALRHCRYEAWVGSPIPGTVGRYRQDDMGRFASAWDAVRWADIHHPDAPLVTVTLFAALDGWRGHRSTSRIDGAWLHESQVGAA